MSLTSLITPTHNISKLRRLYESILKQTIAPLEWIVLVNGTADMLAARMELGADVRPWVKFYKSTAPAGVVGAIKREAFLLATGEILAEVDHDDELTPNCIEELERNKDKGDMLYSDCLELDWRNGEPKAIKYPEAHGWRYYKANLLGADYEVCNAFDAKHPAVVGRIWYAPNHIRAWKRDFYWRIGGHDATLDVCDDQDLMIKSYLAGTIFHINAPLYVQHIHGGNTSVNLDRNAKIQTTCLQLHDKYIYQLACRWANLKGLRKLDLCGGHNKPDGFESVDLANADIIHDLNVIPWPFADNSVGVIRAHDALEHLPNKLAVIKEIYRVLAPGGMLLSHTPSTDGRGAFQDPTHNAFYNSNSFWYYSKREQAAYIGSPVRFQTMRVFNHFPSDWHREHNICYVAAQLIALKGGDERSYAPGAIEI